MDFFERTLFVRSLRVDERSAFLVLTADLLATFQWRVSSGKIFVFESLGSELFERLTEA